MKPPSADQIRNSLKVGFAGFLAAGVYAFFGGNANHLDGFYVVYGAARSLLPTPEASLADAQARVVGTVFGGAVVALLILALNNWIAIGIGYVIIQLLGRRIGLGPAALINASVMTVLLLAVPSDNLQGGAFVFFRTLWHLIGLAIGMGVERIFWFRSPLQRLQQSEDHLIERIKQLICCDKSQPVEELIAIYAEHCKLRQLMLRGSAGSKRQSVDPTRRDHVLELALRHAVAMQRVPAQLRMIDQRACRDALAEYAELAHA